jgi:hypothetical protein
MSRLLFQLLLCLGLGACSSTDPKSPPSQASGYTIATDNYAVLAEKALTYQADFDWEGWADLLADDVQYFLPDSTLPLVGKAAVLAYWKSWPQRTGLRAWQLSHFNHIPIQSTQALYLSGLAGVYVISMCTGQLTYADGHSRTLRLNYCVHFNAQKRLDRMYSYHNPLPTMATFTNFETIKP